MKKIKTLFFTPKKEMSTTVIHVWIPIPASFTVDQAFKDKLREIVWSCIREIVWSCTKEGIELDAPYVNMMFSRKVAFPSVEIVTTSYDESIEPVENIPDLESALTNWLQRAFVLVQELNDFLILGFDPCINQTTVKIINFEPNVSA